MTITYIANIRLPTEKAHGVQIMKMCEAFAALGHSVTLVVPKRRNDIATDPFEYYGVKPSFQITRLACLDGVRFWGKAGFALQTISFALAAKRLVSRIKSDVLYTRDPGVVAVLSALGNSVAWEIHTADTGLFIAPAMRVASKIVAISQGLYDFLIAHHVDFSRILVAHDAVDPDDFRTAHNKQEVREQLALPVERTILEYVGKFHTLGHSKGVDELISIAGKVAQSHSDLLLLLVGLEPQDIPRATKAAENARLGPHQYRFVGHVPRLTVPAYLYAADILLMNYPDTPHYARMMSPLKVFEYMASGTPIVTTDLPSLREVLTDSEARFVRPGDADAFATAVNQLLNDVSAATLLGEKAREKAKQYSWHIRANSILAFLTV